MSDNIGWSHIYQQNIPQQCLPSDRTYSDTTSMFVEEPTMSTTAPTSTTTTSPTHMSSTGHLNPDGRVAKPVRRRSRASRRTPTTLLNTDASNFRAMVQQFTGGPNASFAMDHHLNNNTLFANNPATRFPFGFNHRQQVAQASPNINPQVLVPNLQYHQGMTQMPTTQPHHPHQQNQFMFSLRNPNMNAPGNSSMELPGGGFGTVDGEGGGGGSSSGVNRRSSGGGGGGFLF